jgi:hypothetical protein
MLHLRPPARQGKCDPYCIVKCDDTKFETAVVKKTYTAEWSDVFSFSARESTPFSTLTLTLMDWDKMSKDDYIGEIALTLDPQALVRVLADGRKYHRLLRQSVPLSSHDLTPPRHSISLSPGQRPGASVDVRGQDKWRQEGHGTRRAAHGIAPQGDGGGQAAA